MEIWLARMKLSWKWNRKTINNNENYKIIISEKK